MHNGQGCLVQQRHAALAMQAAAHLNPHADGSQSDGVGGEAGADTLEVRLPALRWYSNLGALAHAGGVLCCAEPPKRPVDACQASPAQQSQS